MILVGLGFRKLDGSIPVAGSNSYAISAAVHPGTQELDASLFPVQWGALKGIDLNACQHCTFSTQEVASPVVGRRYAGLDQHASDVD